MKHKLLYLVASILILGVLVTATTIITNKDIKYGTNTTLNDTGVFYGNSKAFVRTADVVVCRGTSVVDDLLKRFSCDVVCASTDDDCSNEINSVINQSTVYIDKGFYNLLSPITISTNKHIVYGDGISTELNFSTNGFIITSYYVSLRDLQIYTPSDNIGIEYKSSSGMLSNFLNNVYVTGDKGKELNKGSGVLINDTSGSAIMTTFNFDNLYIQKYTNCLNIQSINSFYTSNNLIVEHCINGILGKGGWGVVNTPWFENVTIGMNLTQGGNYLVTQPHFTAGMVNVNYTLTNVGGYTPTLVMFGGGQNFINTGKYENVDSYPTGNNEGFYSWRNNSDATTTYANRFETGEKDAGYGTLLVKQNNNKSSLVVEKTGVGAGVLLTLTNAGTSSTLVSESTGNSVSAEFDNEDASTAPTIRLKPMQKNVPTCASYYSGSIYYNATHFYGCNGTTWVQLDN